MTIYFVRHGQSEANTEHIFSNEGFKHPLTEQEINQSTALSQLLSLEAFDVFLSSLLLHYL